MSEEQIYSHIDEFNSQTHGSTDYGKDIYYVQSESSHSYCPLSYLGKKVPDLISGEIDLLKRSFVFQSIDLVEHSEFSKWYEKQFAKKLTSKFGKTVYILRALDHKNIFSSLERVNASFEVLREQGVLINSKNLPVQVGEWYARCIFGLKQVKSSSQRGFDFLLGDKKVEVKVHWSEKTSHKGVKIKKSLARLSDSVIIIYIARNFLIKDICYLDSDFVLRKFSSKGHTIFLKDSEVSPYFFSRSSKHFNKVINMSSMLQFSSPTLAMKLDEKLQATN